MNLSATLLLVGLTACVKGELYSELFHWAQVVEENKMVTLMCDEPRLGINTTDETGSVKWYKPSGSLIRTFDNNYKLEKVGGFYNMKLTVYRVNSTNHGIYRCELTKTDSNTIFLIRGANVRGPKYTRFLDEYEYNVIVAVVATVVFLVPLLSACGVWKFRYREEEKEKANVFDMASREDNGSGPVMTEIPGKTIASKAEAPEGNGAYENIATDTRL